MNKSKDNSNGIINSSIIVLVLLLILSLVILFVRLAIQLPHTDDTFVINSKNYDNNGGNQVPTFDINATNSSDAAQQYQNIMRNPDMKRISNNGGANFKIHLNTESLEYRKENSIPFTKAELNKLLKN